MNYTCAKFGDFNFSRSDFIVQPNRHTHRIIDAAKRFTPATDVGVSKYKLLICITVGLFCEHDDIHHTLCAVLQHDSSQHPDPAASAAAAASDYQSDDVYRDVNRRRLYHTFLDNVGPMFTSMSQ